MRTKEDSGRAARMPAMLLVVVALTSTAWGQGKGHDKHKSGPSGGGASVSIVFTPQDRDIVTAWFWQNRNGLPPGLAKRESLPPGLQKQLRRNGTLPPGLQKKLTPLPSVLEVKLAPLPVDIIRVVIGSDLVLMNRRTNLVLDIISNVFRYEAADARSGRGDDEDRDEDDRVRASSPVIIAGAPTPAPASSSNKPAWHAGTTPASAAAAAQQAFDITVRITSPLSTETARAGTRFTGTLEQSIYEGTRMVARKGAQVEGEVIDSDPGGRVHGVASLTVKLTRIQTVRGSWADVSSDLLIVDANATKGKDVTKIAITSAIGTAVGALAGGGKGAAIGAATGAAAGTGVVLATRGDPAVIPSESLLAFVVRSY